MITYYSDMMPIGISYRRRAIDVTMDDSIAKEQEKSIVSIYLKIHIMIFVTSCSIGGPENHITRIGAGTFEPRLDSDRITTQITTGADRYVVIYSI